MAPGLEPFSVYVFLPADRPDVRLRLDDVRLLERRRLLDVRELVFLRPLLVWPD